MGRILLSPPIAFFIILAFVLLLSVILSPLSYRKRTEGKEGLKPYACGEDNYDFMAQPDYSQFFPYAFFFTIAHVATLMITITPVESLKVLGLALLYVAGIAVGLFILLRKDKA
jgi:NADH-quinone oxidoreductase subunit A